MPFEPQRRLVVTAPGYGLFSKLVSIAAVLSACVMTMLAIWLARSGAIDVSGMDMNVVFSIQQMMLGLPLYAAPDLQPYAITQYSPLYYLSVFSLATIGGLSATDPIAITEVARGFSVSVAAALAALSYRFLVRRVGASRRVSFVATAFVMVSTANWYFGARPDVLATFLTILAFYVVSADEPASKRREDLRLLAGVALCIAATLAKQNGAFSGIVVLGFLIATRSWRHAAIAAITFGVAGLSTLLIADALGQHLVANVVDGINNGITVRTSLLLAYRPFFYWFAPVLATSLAALFVLARRGARRVDVLLVIATAISLLLSLASALKRGAAENYFNEFVILGTFVLVSAFGSRYSESRHAIADIPTRLILIAYLLLFFPIRTAHQVYVGYLYHRIAPETRLFSQVDPSEHVRRNIDPGRKAIGFAVGLSNMIPAVMLVPQKEISVAADARGVIDYSRFRDDVRSGRVQFAIMKSGERIETFLGADFSSFVLVREFPFYSVYEYKPARFR